MQNVVEVYPWLCSEWPAPKFKCRGRSGDEWSAACPFCGGGRDRLLLWPHHPQYPHGGYFRCDRGCGEHGDVIEFVRRIRGCGAAEACRILNEDPAEVFGRSACDSRSMAGRPGSGRPGRASSSRADGIVWVPEPARLPDAAWMERAAAFSAHCAGAALKSEDGRAALASRGLTAGTARTLGIGWNAQDRYERCGAWGLPEELNRNGRPRTVWLPRGLVLPMRRRVGTVGLLVRRAEWRQGDRLPKCWQVRGGGNGAFCAGRAGRPVIVVESVLDAALIWQEAGDLVAAVAMNGCTKQPDAETAAFLRAAPLFVLALDFDRPGIAARDFWIRHFPRVFIWSSLGGKDPGEMLQAGFSVRIWVEAALDRAERAVQEETGLQSGASTLSGGVLPPAALPAGAGDLAADERSEAAAACSGPASGPEAERLVERPHAREALAPPLSAFPVPARLFNMGQGRVCWDCPNAYTQDAVCSWTGRCAVDGRAVNVRSICHVSQEDAW